MKTKFFSFAALMLATTLTFSACSDDDGPVNQDPIDLDYTSENADAWGNYMYNTANLLRIDANNLYKYWSVDYDGTGPYAETFKKHNRGDFSSALSCIQEVFEKCAEIANEVGSAKIGDPINLYELGKTQEALYAVESWYSWHSRDDYTNNIWSIRNSYYGKISSNDNNDGGDIQENSLYKLVESLNASKNKELDDAIHAAADAIQNIPQPFRNHINSDEAKAAQDACLTLESLLKEVYSSVVEPAYSKDANNTKLDAIVAQYVDYVVLPTYKSLSEKNEALYRSIETFKNSPSDNNFMTACEAWLTAREPWEKSEGFLFGPVGFKGLDPNMDSWPLDQNGIVNILKSQSWSDLEWSGDYDEDNDAIAAAQNVRGFHTLEYFLFKNGQPRKVNN